MGRRLGESVFVRLLAGKRLMSSRLETPSILKRIESDAAIHDDFTWRPVAFVNKIKNQKSKTIHPHNNNFDDFDEIDDNERATKGDGTTTA